MKSTHLNIFWMLSLVLLFASCERNGSVPDEQTMTSETPSNRIDIPSNVRNNLDITFAKVERRKISKTIRVPGTFELQPLASRDYRLMLSGMIEFAVEQFQIIKPGDVLYHLRSTEWLKIQEEIINAETTLAQVRTKFNAAKKRLETLREANFKRADLEANLAELEADLNKQEAVFHEVIQHATDILNLCNAFGTHRIQPEDLIGKIEHNNRSVPFYQTLEQIDIHAVQFGIVESLALTNGAFAKETTLLLTTVDPKKIRFRAAGLQSDLNRFLYEKEVRIVPPQSSTTNLNESIEANLLIGLEADPQSRTIDLFGLPKELKPWIRPGVVAFMEITIESTAGMVLAIPLSAVMKDGLTHVFFKRDPFNLNKAIRVEADLGVEDGRWIEVKSEVGPKDEVVLNGAYELNLASTTNSTTQKGGHFHADGSFHGGH